MDKIKITPKEKKVLIKLLEGWEAFGGETSYYPFKPLIKSTGLTHREVRLACRSLKRKGLAEFLIGLMDFDGQFAGAGYGVTRLGAALLNPCDVCGDLVDFEYDGKKQCNKHYDGK